VREDLFQIIVRADLFQIIVGEDLFQILENFGTICGVWTPFKELYMEYGPLLRNSCPPLERETSFLKEGAFPPP